MLGEKLVSLETITPDQLYEVLALQKDSDKKLGEIIIDKGYATQNQVKSAL